MVTVAVVGAGGMGKTHLNNLRQMENVRVDAICDPNPAVADLAREMDAGYYQDLNAMLKETGASVVMIFTPTFLHAGQIEAVLRSGRHCVSEKPLCLSSVQARELFEIADQMHVHLYVAHVLHFMKEYEILDEIVRSGRYGKVRDAFFYRLSQRPQWSAGCWLFQPEKSGLIPFDLHIHELELMISLFGRPVRVHRQETVSGQQQKEHYRFLYDYEDKTICAEASWYDAPIPFTTGYRLCFEKAVVIYENNVLTAFEQSDPCGKVLYTTQQGEGTTINVSSALPYKLEMEHFLACVEECKESSIVTREQIIATFETLETLGK